MGFVSGKVFQQTPMEVKLNNLEPVLKIAFSPKDEGIVPSQGVRNSKSIGFEDAARHRDGKILAVRWRNWNFQTSSYTFDRLHIFNSFCQCFSRFA